MHRGVYKGDVYGVSSVNKMAAGRGAGKVHGGKLKSDII